MTATLSDRFKFLSHQFLYSTIPKVCRLWADLSLHPSLWSDFHVNATQHSYGALGESAFDSRRWRETATHQQIEEFLFWRKSDNIY